MPSIKKNKIPLFNDVRPVKDMLLSIAPNGRYFVDQYGGNRSFTWPILHGRYLKGWTAKKWTNIFKTG